MSRVAAFPLFPRPGPVPSHARTAAAPAGGPSQDTSLAPASGCPVLSGLLTCPGRRAPQQGRRLCLEPPSAWRIGQRVPATAAGVGGSQHTGEGLGQGRGGRQGRVRVLTRGFFRAPVLVP